MLTALALALSACGDGTNSPLPPPLPCNGIALMGDSLTYLPGWADIVADELAPTRVRVEASPGLTSASWLPGGSWFTGAAFDTDTPCTVSILLGTNDILRFVPTPVSDYSDRIRFIAAELVRFGVRRVVLVGPPMTVGLNASINPQISVYIDELLDICDKSRSDQIECGPSLFDELSASDFVSDGIHFSVAGGERVAALMGPVLGI